MAELTRTSPNTSSYGAGGPYEAIVVNHLDTTYMGTLEVELLKYTSTGNNPERTGQTHTVRYLSPFYGVTHKEEHSQMTAMISPKKVMVFGWSRLM